MATTDADVRRAHEPGVPRAQNGRDAVGLPVIGQPSPQQREAFKAAKATLGITDSLKFVPAQPGCGKALSFGPRPDFACDWLTLEGAEPQDVEDALGWLLDLRHDWRAQSMAVWLEFAFGRSGIAEVA